MDRFRTTVSIAPSNHQLTLKSRVLTIGSCFADAIGGRLTKYKVKTAVNPFGTLYNPHSIHKVLHFMTMNSTPPESTYLENNGMFLNYDVHSAMHAHNRSELADIINKKISLNHHFLKTTHWVLITYGTAWIYRRIENNEVVANCHKMPSHLFSKSLLSDQEIIESFDTFYHNLKKINSSVKIILTVSPVRHLKDTLELNSVSKAVLRAACHSLSVNYNDVKYFPAYEIMMDDLRDYRFYKADMIHPTEVAETYIWEKFIDSYADQALKEFIPEWNSILTALAHRPFHPQTDAHQLFLKRLLEKIERYREKVNVDEEINFIKSQETG